MTDGFQQQPRSYRIVRVRREPQERALLGQGYVPFCSRSLGPLVAETRLSTKADLSLKRTRCYQETSCHKNKTHWAEHFTARCRYRRPRYHRSMVRPQRVLAYVLAHPNATIGEIPRTCGYKNQETFSRLINTPKERCVSRAYAQVLLTQSDRIRFASRLSHQIGEMTESIDDFDVSIFDVVAGTTTID